MDVVQDREYGTDRSLGNALEVLDHVTICNSDVSLCGTRDVYAFVAQGGHHDSPQVWGRRHVFGRARDRERDQDLYLGPVLVIS
jgi:hypothetical protein